MKNTGFAVYKSEGANEVERNIRQRILLSPLPNVELTSGWFITNPLRKAQILVNCESLKKCPGFSRLS